MYKALCPIDGTGATIAQILNGLYDKPGSPSPGLMQFIRTVGDVPIVGNSGRLAYIDLNILPTAPFGGLPAAVYERSVDGRPTTLKKENCHLYFSTDGKADIYSPDGSVIPQQATVSGEVCGYLARNGSMTPNLQFTSEGFQKMAFLLNAMALMRQNGWHNDPNILGALGLGNEPNHPAGYRPYHVNPDRSIGFIAWLPMQAIIYAALWKLIMRYAMEFCDGMLWPSPHFVMGEMAEYHAAWQTLLDNNDPLFGNPNVPAPSEGWPDSCYLNLVLAHYYQLYPEGWLATAPRTFHFHLYHQGMPPADFVNRLIAATSLTGTYSFANSQYYSGQAPFNAPAMRYAVSEWAGYKTISGVERADAFFNEVWALVPANGTLWNQGLHVMYWYTDYGAWDAWYMQTLDSTLTTLQGTPKAGQAIKAAVAP